MADSVHKTQILLFLIILLFISVTADADMYDDDTTLDYSWEPASGSVAHYDIYVSIDGGAFELLDITSTPSYTLTGAEVGATYQLKVQAVDAAGTTGPVSDESDPTTVVDSAGDPTLVVLVNLTAIASDSKVTIQWTTESEINCAGFNIYRSERTNSGYVKLNDSLIPGSADSTSGDTYSYADKTVANGITYYYKLQEVELDGAKTTHGPISVATPIGEVTEREKRKVVPAETDIEPSKLVIKLKLPEKFLLAQNFPNPFNPDTWIPYALPKGKRVIIRIYNISGKLIRTLSLGAKPAGEYFTRQKAAYWDGKDQTGRAVSSGLYFYTLKAGNFQATRRMVIVK